MGALPVLAFSILAIAGPRTTSIVGALWAPLVWVVPLVVVALRYVKRTVVTDEGLEVHLGRRVERVRTEDLIRLWHLRGIYVLHYRGRFGFLVAEPTARRLFAWVNEIRPGFKRSRF